MRIISLLDRSLFGPDTDVRVGKLFRIALASQLCVEFILLIPSWVRYYGEPPISEHYYPNLLSISSSPLYLYGVLGVGLIASLALAAGAYARLSALILFLIQRSMVLQSPVIVNGHDYVFTVLLFCAIGMPLGSSPKSLSNRLTAQTIFSSIFARRLAQILFVFMYLSTGLAKPLDDIHWRDGSALSWITLSTRWSSFPDATILTNPYVSMALTYYTLGVELLAPLLVWFARFRLPMILAMCSLHLGIITLMDSCILLFNTASITWVLLFAKDQDLDTLARWLGSFRARCRGLIKK
jgi:hypothetical protein